MLGSRMVADGPGSPADMTSLHVQRATRGDGASREWIVERFTPLLLAQANFRVRGRLRQLCEPADLVQEVWAITLAKLDRIRPRDGRWAPVVIKFLATTLLQRAHYHLRRAMREGGNAAASAAARADDVPALATGVVTRMQRDEASSAIHQALAELTEEDRAVVVLRGIEQLANGSVARQLGLSDSAVTRRYQAALASLRHRLPQSVFTELE